MKEFYKINSKIYDIYNENLINNNFCNLIKKLCKKTNIKVDN